MATKAEKDALTGTATTGHEWDGIKELNTPLPKWWVYVFYATILFSVVWWSLYPAWPSLSGHTRGLLGTDQRMELEKVVAKAQAAQAQWRDQIAAKDAAAIIASPELLQFAVAGGGVAFKENCAACHGLGGAGQGFFPTLADDDWLWGGTVQQIEYTIRHGVRNGADPEARDTVMPSFGADGVLTKDQIDDVVQHVLSLTGQATDQAAAARGAAVFAENCVACHGDQGGGNQEMGAPALNDAIWLYGSEPAKIAAQVTRPHLGVMPNWQGRLDDTTIKMVAAYVHSLGGGK